jgi:hypothetical protein
MLKEKCLLVSKQLFTKFNEMFGGLKLFIQFYKFSYDHKKCLFRSKKYIHEVLKKPARFKMVVKFYIVFI